MEEPNLPKSSVANEEPSRESTGKGFHVPAKTDRYPQQSLFIGGQVDLKISARDTNGALCIYDAIRLSKGGPPLHYHKAQDEWFYVIRGQFIVRVGDETFNLHPGDSAFAPRNIPHTYAMISEGAGQLLLLYQPAGTMEEFFLQFSKLANQPPENQQAAIKRLFEEHGMEVVGPPLILS